MWKQLITKYWKSLAGIIFLAFGSFISLSWNDYILLGVFVTALGSIFFLIDTVKSYTDTKKSNIIVEKKIEEFAGKLDAAITTQPLIPKISEIDSEFDIWAKDYIHRVDKKKIEIAEADLSDEKLKQELNDEWINCYQSCIDVIRNVSFSVKKTINTNIDYDIPNLPRSIYNEDFYNYYAKIKFNEDYIWYLSFIEKYPKYGIPNIMLSVIDVDYKKDEIFLNYHKLIFRNNEEISFKFDINQKTLLMDKKYRILKTKKGDIHFNTDEIEIAFTTIFKELFDNQLALIK